MKMKEFGPLGEARVPGAPLGPRICDFSTREMNKELIIENRYFLQFIL